MTLSSPSPEAAAAKRLAYFIKFLEYPDRQISDDAYAEFANAPYKDIASVSKLLPREKVARWVADAETPQTRMGLYGLLLGLSGNASDAKLMKQKISTPSEEFRLGIDGVMSGYLVLTDAKGRKKLVPFSETYAAMQALRFMWSYAEGRISKPRLRQSMRILLERPELADLVIADLARWKDWSIQNRLMTMYDEKAFNVPAIKRAVVRYMLVCTKDIPKGAAAGPLPKHVQDAMKHLAALRKRDPKTVTDAERFFFLK